MVANAETQRTRQSTKGNRVAMNEREKCRECDDRRATTLSKKPRARRNERRRGGKVGCDNHEWRLCDEAHANNDRWRSSDNDSRDVGQTWLRANKQLASKLRKHRQRDGRRESLVQTTRHSTTMQQPTEQADTERGKDATTRGKDDATRGEQRWWRYFFSHRFQGWRVFSIYLTYYVPRHEKLP